MTDITPTRASLCDESRCFSFDNNMTLTASNMASPRTLQTRAQSTGALGRTQAWMTSSARLGSIREGHSDSSSGDASRSLSNAKPSSATQSKQWPPKSRLRHTHCDHMDDSCVEEDSNVTGMTSAGMSVWRQTPEHFNQENNGHTVDDPTSDQSQHEESSVDSGQCSDFLMV